MSGSPLLDFDKDRFDSFSFTSLMSRFVFDLTVILSRELLAADLFFFFGFLANVAYSYVFALSIDLRLGKISRLLFEISIFLIYI